MKAALTGTAFPKPANYETLIFLVQEELSLLINKAFIIPYEPDITVQKYLRIIFQKMT